MANSSNCKHLIKCRFCDSQDLKIALDLGSMPLAGGFLKKEDLSNEYFFPLELQFCINCYLVQVSCVPDPKILFNEKYFFHSSSTYSLVEHFAKYADVLYNRYLHSKHRPQVLEIGCNDGVLLNPLSKLGCKVIGVDPSSSVTQKINIPDSIIKNNFFTEELSNDIFLETGKVDAITANFSFAHIDNMHDVMKGIVKLIKDDGIFVFELYYLKTIIEEMNYDMIYHEHMSYYSLMTLKIFLSKYGMDIFDIEYFPRIRSGALRVHSKLITNNKFTPSESFLKLYESEIQLGLNTINPFIDYSNKITKTKNDLLDLIITLKNQGKIIVGYGASGRSTVIMNYCGINQNHIDYIVDDAVEKQGYLTPGNHIEIMTWDQMTEKCTPDYVILFAWSFIDEVLNKRNDFRLAGGKFILPLPSVQIL